MLLLLYAQAYGVRRGYPAFVSKVRSGGLAEAYVAELTRVAVSFNEEVEKQNLRLSRAANSTAKMSFKGV